MTNSYLLCLELDNEVTAFRVPILIFNCTIDPIFLNLTWFPYHYRRMVCLTLNLYYMFLFYKQDKHVVSFQNVEHGRTIGNPVC
jgi:hypothetical protein